MIFKDQNGFITRDELESIMGGVAMDDNNWESILDECDVNKDGQVKS